MQNIVVTREHQRHLLLNSFSFVCARAHYISHEDCRGERRRESCLIFNRIIHRLFLLFIYILPLCAEHLASIYTIKAHTPHELPVCLCVCVWRRNSVTRQSCCVINTALNYTRVLKPHVSSNLRTVSSLAPSTHTQTDVVHAQVSSITAI